MWFKCLGHGLHIVTYVQCTRRCVWVEVERDSMLATQLAGDTGVVHLEFALGLERSGAQQTETATVRDGLDAAAG